MDVENLPLLLTVSQVAELLNIGESTVRKLDSEGKLPRSPIDCGVVRYHKRVVLAMCEGRDPVAEWQFVKAGIDSRNKGRPPAA